MSNNLKLKNIETDTLWSGFILNMNNLESDLRQVFQIINNCFEVYLQGILDKSVGKSGATALVKQPTEYQVDVCIQMIKSALQLQDHFEIKPTAPGFLFNLDMVFQRHGNSIIMCAEPLFGKAKEEILGGKFQRVIRQSYLSLSCEGQCGGNLKTQIDFSSFSKIFLTIWPKDFTFSPEELAVEAWEVLTGYKRYEEVIRLPGSGSLQSRTPSHLRNQKFFWVDSHVRPQVVDLDIQQDQNITQISPKENNPLTNQRDWIMGRVFHSILIVNHSDYEVHLYPKSLQNICCRKSKDAPIPNPWNIKGSIITLPLDGCPQLSIHIFPRNYHPSPLISDEIQQKAKELETALLEAFTS